MRHLIAYKKFGSRDYWQLCNSMSSHPPLHSLIRYSKIFRSYILLKFYSSRVSYPEFPLKIESLLNNMHTTPFMVSAAISKLDPHNACYFMVSPQYSLRNLLPNWPPFPLNCSICLASYFFACWKFSSVVPPLRIHGDNLILLIIGLLTFYRFLAN